jgi:hypothetical protein
MLHMALINDRPFQMRVSEEFLRKLDEWRRQQPDIPSRAESIRRLIEMGMKMPKHGAPSGGGGRGESDKPAGSVAAAPKKPAAPARKAEPAAPRSKLDQIRALRERAI